MNKLQMQYNTDYFLLEEKLYDFIADYQINNQAFPSNKSIKEEAQKLFREIVKMKFNAVWF